MFQRCISVNFNQQQNTLRRQAGRQTDRQTERKEAVNTNRNDLIGSRFFEPTLLVAGRVIREEIAAISFGRA